MITYQLLRTETWPDRAQAETVFRLTYPGFERTSPLDTLRATEYARLGNHTYLDYTGGGLYAECQIRAHMDVLRRHVFGNPHSINPTSLVMTRLVERARASVLEYFRADPSEYLVIFTPNASGALRLVGESYPFAPGGQYALLFDNHNSVNGIREYARVKGARITNLPLVAPDFRANEVELAMCLREARPGYHNLFSFPAQSNFTGKQHPLAWIEEAQALGWDVLLDAAAFVPTNCLDLSRWHPDFVPLSFYKMFGYPTGVGCLLARKEALARLCRPWFAGGTILAVSVLGDWHKLAQNEEGFEDGTLNYLSLPAIEIGLHYIQTIGIDIIHERVMCLTGWLLEQLASLRHSNGVPMVCIHGPQNCTMRGATISFNMLDPHGRMIDERVVDREAAANDFSIRTGCFCNPGAGEAAYNLGEQALTALKSNDQDITYDEYIEVLGLKSAGGHRISLGIVSNFADVYRFVQFLRTFKDVFPNTSNVLPRLHC